MPASGDKCLPTLVSAMPDEKLPCLRSVVKGSDENTLSEDVVRNVVACVEA